MDNTTTSLITVIVPCYNQAQYLDECLQSVLDQTYENWECIIVNDGSPDNTEEVAKFWTEKDERFKYLKKENGGLSSARNAGLEIAQGEWIQFLDCDDKIGADKFQDASAYFSSYDLIISNYQLFRQEEMIPDYCTFIEENLSFKSLLLNWDDKFTIPIHCAIFKKSFIHNYFNENLKAKEDFIFWLQYMQNNPRYIIITKRQAYYRMHLNSMTKNHSLMIDSENDAQEFIIKNIKSEYINDFVLKVLVRKKNEMLRLKERNDALTNENQKLRNARYFRYKAQLFNLINRFR